MSLAIPARRTLLTPNQGVRPLGALAALQMAKQRRVDFVYVSDSNGQYNGWGWSSGFEIALGKKYGLYATALYPIEPAGTAISVAGAPAHNAVSPFPTNSATTGAPAAHAPFALPYSTYCYQASGALGTNNGVIVIKSPLDAYSNPAPAIDVNARLRGWFSYGTFASSGGSFTPAVRLDASPFTVLAASAGVNTQTGTDGQAYASLDLAAGARANNISFRWQMPGWTPSVSKNTQFWSRVENRDATAGIAVTQLYSQAGKSLYDYATTLNAYTQAQWTAYFTGVTYSQVQAGQSPMVVVFINSGDNDINDARTSIGPVGGLANNTAAGYADNLAACVNVITAGWTGAGLPIGNNGTAGLYFLVVPSHVYSTPDNAALVSMRAAAKAYAAGKANMSFVDLAQLVPYAELISAGGYNAAPHLQKTTYQYIASKLVSRYLP